MPDIHSSATDLTTHATGHQAGKETTMDKHQQAGPDEATTTPAAASHEDGHEDADQGTAATAIHAAASITGQDSDPGIQQVAASFTQPTSQNIDPPHHVHNVLANPGHASTAHAAQGLTVDAAHLVTDRDVDTGGLYVGLTRGRIGGPRSGKTLPMQVRDTQHQAAQDPAQQGSAQDQDSAADVPGDHAQAAQVLERFTQENPAADLDDLQVWDDQHRSIYDDDWADDAPGQAAEGDAADLAELTWTERTLQQDGTWLHTRTVTRQVPAADVHDWAAQDDESGASSYDATHEAWLDALGLEDEL